jgi:hypothetical protein
VDPNGNIAWLSGAADYFEGLSEKGRAYVDKLNTKLNEDYHSEKINDLQAIEIRAHANVDMGVTNALTALGSKYFDLLDAEVDAIIGHHPATRFFDFGKDAKKRTEKRKQTVVAAAKTVIQKGAQFTKKAIENPGGTIADTSSILYHGSKDYLYETFWEGDLNKTSALTETLIESLIPGKLVDDAFGLAKVAARTPDVLDDVFEVGEITRQGHPAGIGPGAKWVGELTEVEETVTYFRSEGRRGYVSMDADSNIKIRGNNVQLSRGNDVHANYFQDMKPYRTLYSWEVPKWLDDLILETKIPQVNAKNNPLHGWSAKHVDPDIPYPNWGGHSLELSEVLVNWMDEYAVPGSGKIVRTPE